MKNITFLLTIIALFSCNNPENNSIWSLQDGCNLDRLEYQEISDTIHVTKNGDLETGVKANGKMILNGKINVDTIAAYLRDGDKVFINQHTLKTVRVSQAFYEEYSKQREFLCQIIQGFQSGIISSEEGKKRGEQYYLDMIHMFSGLREQDEVRKLQEEKGKRDSIVKMKHVETNITNSPGSTVVIGDGNAVEHK